MNRITNALLGGALVLMSPAVMAQSADLSVKGSISPEACILNIAGGGNFSIGTVASSNIPEETETLITAAPRALSITCPSPILVGVKINDANPGSVYNGTTGGADLSRLGLGLTKDDERIGYGRLRVSQINVDELAAVNLVSLNNGETWQRVGYSALRSTLSARSGAVNGFGRADATNTLIPVRNLTANLTAEAGIAPGETLTLDDEVAIGGSASLELVYF